MLPCSRGMTRTAWARTPRLWRYGSSICPRTVDEKDRQAVPGRELVNKSDPLVIEIWNLVFIQYNRKADGSLELLPHRHVDTGMGFERLVMAVNGNKSNYDGDMFQDIISRIAELSGHKYGAESEQVDVAMRVRAFPVPSGTGAGGCYGRRLS